MAITNNKEDNYNIEKETPLKKTLIHVMWVIISCEGPLPGLKALIVVNADKMDFCMAELVEEESYCPGLK